MCTSVVEGSQCTYMAEKKNANDPFLFVFWAAGLSQLNRQ